MPLKLHSLKAPVKDILHVSFSVSLAEIFNHLQWWLVGQEPKQIFALSPENLVPHQACRNWGGGGGGGEGELQPQYFGSTCFLIFFSKDTAKVKMVSRHE